MISSLGSRFGPGALTQVHHPTGPAGGDGVDGTDGRTWTSSTSDPSGGSDGDFHFRSDTRRIFKRVGGVWSAIASLSNDGLVKPDVAGYAEGDTFRDLSTGILYTLRSGSWVQDDEDLIIGSAVAMGHLYVLDFTAGEIPE